MRPQFAALQELLESFRSAPILILSRCNHPELFYHMVIRRVSRRQLASVALLTAIAGASTVASAHDTWLLPSSLRVPVGQAVTLNLSSGEAFPNDDFAIDVKRVTRTVARLSDASAPLGESHAGGKELQYTWRPKTAGIATIAIELMPKVLTLTPDKIEEYFLDINADANLRATWAKIPSPKQWRESYSKHAKTFVRVGDPGSDASWSKPLGLGLELVPLSNPTTLSVGDTMRIKALYNGAPMKGLQMGAQGPGLKTAKFVTTDADGTAKVAFTSVGTWLINGTNLRRTTRKYLEWESDFTTLTVAVSAKK